jgi:polyhydroxyalkanoate synthesis regulator phasin
VSQDQEVVEEYDPNDEEHVEALRRWVRDNTHVAPDASELLERIERLERIVLQLTERLNTTDPEWRGV